MPRLSARLTTVACAAWLLAAAAWAGELLHSTPGWRDGRPLVTTQLLRPPADVEKVAASVALCDAQGAELWRGTLTLAPAADGRWLGEAAPEKFEAPAGNVRVEVSVRRRDLGLVAEERLVLSPPGETVRWHGLCREGEYPAEKVALVMALGPVQREGLAEVELNVALRDAAENAILQKTFRMPVAAQGSEAAFEVTPDPAAVGPFSLDYAIENDAAGIYFRASERLPVANVMVPVSSFELDDKTWFGSTVRPPAGNSSGHYYYSQQFVDDDPAPYPAVTYEEGGPHSGRRCLRVDYQGRREAYVFSRQLLPALPTMARIWVRGNASNDRLVVTWNDNIDHRRPAWQRSANFSAETVCTLDFSDWREFRVPVLGYGLQIKRNIAGSSPDIDVPIGVCAFTIVPGPPVKDREPNEPRTVWLDDLVVETQAMPEEALGMELRTDTADRRLHEGATLFVSLGNGTRQAIAKGVLRLLAKDRGGNPVWEHSVDVAAGASAFAFAEVPLAGLWRADPAGPVDLTVSFTAPQVTGLRTSQRLTLKHAHSAGLVFDFEDGESCNGFWDGRPASPVAGGAEGSAHALAIGLEPPPEEELKRQRRSDEKPPNPLPHNAVVLHPALPGLVDRIQMSVRGSGPPVRLTPILLDAGLSGMWLRNYNVFRLGSVTVEGTQWRTVEFTAPRVPAQWWDRNLYFLFEPSYPLNLVISAEAPDGQPTQLFIDRVRVTTHLEPAEELAAAIVQPDASHLYRPGQPLTLALTNFSARERSLEVACALDTLRQSRAAERRQSVKVPAGARILHPLVDALEPGLYSLTVRVGEAAAAGGADKTPDAAAAAPPDGGLVIEEAVQVLDAPALLGAPPAEFFCDLPEVRRRLGLGVERVKLDWDNAEAMPNFFHYGWFNVELDKASAGGRLQTVPVLGFSADWAGPAAQDSVAAGAYGRNLGNYLQTPVRLADWSAYVREYVREYAGRFPQWVFWENPDLEGPQGIPVARYREMLAAVAKWVRLYDPKAAVVAGGLNFDRVLAYLAAVGEPATLDFDEIAVQMNLGELSPEEADMEGFLDDLAQMLDLAGTRRRVQLTELDWPIGAYVSPGLHAAYHARALLILNSRGAEPHSLAALNGGREFLGYGLLYSPVYGNSENVQGFRPTYVPKPAAFTTLGARRFLSAWTFLQSVPLPDDDLLANRAFLYGAADGRLAVAFWRVGTDPRTYRLPAGWKGARAEDIAGLPVPLDGELRGVSLPQVIFLPEKYSREQLAFDLRHLEPADGTGAVWLDLHLAEEDSRRRVAYTCEGNTTVRPLTGRLPGLRGVTARFVFGMTAEQFQFTAPAAGNALLRRRWHREAGGGTTTTVELNGRALGTWDLAGGEMDIEGLRESTFVLPACTAGVNTLRLVHAAPANAAGYRVEPLTDPAVALDRWGVLHATQSRGELELRRNARGTPLAIGKQGFARGLGSHATALIEYPLDGQFKAFSVSVGVDAVTDGRGSVIFEVLVDGQPRAKSPVMNGFSRPLELRVEGIEEAKRLVLAVRDAGDGTEHDVADWVDGRLELRP